MQRLEDYRQELQDIQDRVSSNPLLVERQALVSGARHSCSQEQEFAYINALRSMKYGACRSSAKDLFYTPFRPSTNLTERYEPSHSIQHCKRVV